jgi:hypothetical protein
MVKKDKKLRWRTGTQSGLKGAEANPISYLIAYTFPFGVQK